MYTKGTKERSASIFSACRALSTTTVQGLSSGFSLSYINIALAPRVFLYALKMEAAGFSERSIPFYEAKQRHALADSNFSV
jgi:hypothetical protein